MLVLSRKRGQKVVINPGPHQVVVTVIDIDRDKIRLGITAARDVPIFREELLPIPHGETRDNYLPED